MARQRDHTGDEKPAPPPAPRHPGAARPLVKPSAERAALMRRVRREGTTPELVVRELLRGGPVRWRRNVKTLPGSPDLASKRHRIAIFVHGCFWHRHRGCARTTTPTQNRAFWLEKFARNYARDAENQRALRRVGYRMIVVWECETRNVDRLGRRLRRHLARWVPEDAASR